MHRWGHPTLKGTIPQKQPNPSRSQNSNPSAFAMSNSGISFLDFLSSAQTYYAKGSATAMVFVNKNNKLDDFIIPTYNKFEFTSVVHKEKQDNNYITAIFFGHLKSPQFTISVKLKQIPILEPLIERIMNGESIHIKTFFEEVVFTLRKKEEENKENLKKYYENLFKSFLQQVLPDPPFRFLPRTSYQTYEINEYINKYPDLRNECVGVCTGSDYDFFFADIYYI